MIEEQFAARLRAAVDDEPPLGFDPDEVPVLSRRRRRQRLLALSSVGATVAVIGGIVATLFVAAPTGDKAASPQELEPEVITCGEVDFDGDPPVPFPDAERHIERLNKDVPEALEKHLHGHDFEVLGEGMLRYGCVPTLMGTYRPADAEWAISVRLSHEFDRFSPDEGIRAGHRRFWSDGSLVRFSETAGTRHDQDGLIVEVFVTPPSGLTAPNSDPTADELGNLVADRALRF